MPRGCCIFKEKTLNSEKKTIKTPVGVAGEAEVHIPDIIWCGMDA